MSQRLLAGAGIRGAGILVAVEPRLQGTSFSHTVIRNEGALMVKKRFFAILTLTVIAVLPPSLAAGAKEKILYRFTGKKDGGSPSSSLTMDASGNLYGTTGLGGDLSQCSNNGCGTVFELKPSGKGQWQETVLYAFKGSSDGSYPGGKYSVWRTLTVAGRKPSSMRFAAENPMEWNPRRA